VIRDLRLRAVPHRAEQRPGRRVVAFHQAGDHLYPHLVDPPLEFLNQRTTNARPLMIRMNGQPVHPSLATVMGPQHNPNEHMVYLRSEEDTCLLRQLVAEREMAVSAPRTVIQPGRRPDPDHIIVILFRQLPDPSVRTCLHATAYPPHSLQRKRRGEDADGQDTGHASLFNGPSALRCRRLVTYSRRTMRHDEGKQRQVGRDAHRAVLVGVATLLIMAVHAAPSGALPLSLGFGISVPSSLPAGWDGSFSYLTGELFLSTTLTAVLDLGAYPSSFPDLFEATSALHVKAWMGAVNLFAGGGFSLQWEWLGSAWLLRPHLSLRAGSQIWPDRRICITLQARSQHPIPSLGSFAPELSAALSVAFAPVRPEPLAHDAASLWLVIGLGVAALIAFLPRQ
jgi:hypothetical protein